MSGEEEVVLDRASDEPVSASALPGSDHRIVLHDTPPQYLLSVEYGDLEALFNDGTGVLGRQERMQALDFYYGAADGDEGPITRRCWRHLREELDHAAGRTLNDTEFQEAIRQRLRSIVRRDDGTADPETDFTHDARLVFPGTFCFRADSQMGNPIRRHRFNAEQRMWDGNQGLGKIPITARVTNLVTGDFVAGIRVLFELVAPFDPPEGQKAYLSHISGATEKARSPRRYVDSHLPRAHHAVYGFNCPEAKGGKTPADVNGSLFAQGAVPGFPHQSTLESRPNNYSVVGTTDAQGNTGVVFQPSRMAGDCYKIRVRVLVDGRESSVDETRTSGVLTVWRSLRVSRIVIKPPQGAFAGEPPIAPTRVGALGHIRTTVMRNEFAKAFHHLETDRQARNPVSMSAHAYREAVAYAKRGADNPRGFDLNALVKEDFASPFLLWLDTDTNYNARKSPASAALDLTREATWDEIQDLLDSLLSRLLQYWGGGNLPGIVVIRSEIGDSYSYWGNPNRPTHGTSRWVATTSGVANRHRGCFVWYTEDAYLNRMPYGVTANTLHEMGHVLFLRHHYTAGALDSERGGFSANHDSRDWCLMGYLDLTTDDYCGKCLLKLRGWDESAI